MVNMLYDDPSATTRRHPNFFSSQFTSSGTFLFSFIRWNDKILKSISHLFFLHHSRVAILFSVFFYSLEWYIHESRDHPHPHPLFDLFIGKKPIKRSIRGWGWSRLSRYMGFSLQKIGKRKSRYSLRAYVFLVPWHIGLQKKSPFYNSKTHILVGHILLRYKYSVLHSIIIIHIW